ncbi:MAG: xanthine dehydrogenase family protein molybdopterin-binding subunit, partial [Alphaproteobacteria bacterium]
MMKFGVSQPVRRVEDVRLLTGKGRYIDDIAPANALRAFILRSPEAHADIVSIDTAEAAAAPGVRLILTAADLEGAVENSIDYFTTENSDGSPVATPITPILATGRVRHVGQPVAAIIADTLAQARDAAELIEVEYRERPAHVATATGGPAVHDEAPDNICFDWSIGDEAATTAAFDAAAHRVTLDLIDNRVISNPMETRGATAQWDGAKLTVTINGQGVWMQKASLAKKLGLDPDHVRVINPDVGGGFGTKAFDYPEHFIVAEAARRLGQPVHWVADRSEGMVSDVSGRDHVTRMQAAFDADHRLIGLRVDCTANLGAYCSAFAQLVPGFVASRVFPGVYDVQAAFMRVIGVFTNTTPVDAYRGAGRPEAIYALERLMDYSARQLGVDPLELRRKSFIPPEKFPYTSAAGEIYDVGDFDRVLRRAEKEADLAGFAARKAQSAARGKLRGLGTCYYIESILGDQNETTKIEFAEDGMVDLYVGTQSNGQGHETVFAQILHQRAGVPFEKIRFVQGDSDRIAKGGGTGGSRSVTMQGNSINATADIMIENFMQLAEEELEAA